MREVQTMRKHSARKLLHFVLDLLPILVLPIFAIYEINHDNNVPITVTDGAWEHRALYETNVVNDWSDVIPFNLYHYDSLILDDTRTGETFNLFIVNAESITTISSDYYYDDMAIGNYNSNEYNFINYYVDDHYSTITCSNLNGYISFDFEECVGTLINVDFYFFDEYEIEFFNSYMDHMGYYDLPSSSTYQSYQYIYNENHVYDNTDIGSQMLYAIYKPVKDYFNFNNVFNFGEIYHWFELNMFGGNAPMPIFIVWNIIVYQFLMDLMFLVYSIFMFIIDFTSECLERCFSFSRHGGSR